MGGLKRLAPDQIHRPSKIIWKDGLPSTTPVGPPAPPDGDKSPIRSPDDQEKMDQDQTIRNTYSATEAKDLVDSKSPLVKTIILRLRDLIGNNDVYVISIGFGENWFEFGDYYTVDGILQYLTDVKKSYRGVSQGPEYDGFEYPDLLVRGATMSR